MRFIFENLHANSFLVKTLYDSMLTSRRKTYKHRNIIDYLCIKKKKIYMLAEQTSFNGPLRRVFNNRIGRIIECYITCMLNGIKWNQIVILKQEDIRPDDILLCYLFDRDKYEKDNIKKLNCYKILDLNHFYARIPLLKYCMNDFECLVSEANVIEHSQLLHVICNDYKGDTYVKPYSFNSRFQNRKAFIERENKAVATGTWETLDEYRYQLFKEVYKTNCLHPMRRELYENRKKWKEQIECYITHFPDDDIKKIDIEDPLLCWIATKKTEMCIKRQSHYMSFDMSELYNNYRMAVIPEEIVGLPAIGFVEAMASGCAYVGKECSIYDELGMKPEVHYIAYDGTSDNLLEKIKYYQEHFIELEQIASCGCQFVNENLNGYIVAKQFYKKIYENAKIRIHKNET